MSVVLHVSPHPDDETLGCGGTLLRHRDAGDSVHWLIVSELTPEHGHSPKVIQDLEATIGAVAREYEFTAVHRLRLPDSRLDAMPLVDIITLVAGIIRTAAPSIVYVPHPADVHSDHRVVFDAVVPATKWFRFESVRQVLAYETLSETNFGLDPRRSPIQPNVYREITAQLERKLAILRLYERTELGEHPFPRSEAVVRALALLRGSEAGCDAAEAFTLLRERT